MKKLFYFIISLLLFANIALAEWYNPFTWFNKPVVGDTISPMPMFYQSGTSILPRVRQLNLILDRGITVGNSTSTATGTIRWSGTAFEGYNGSTWGSLGGGSADALTTSTIFAGDVTGTSSSMLLSKIQGRTVTTTQNPSIGYILKWDGTYWNYKPDDTGAGGGITNLNGQTGGTQSFASTSNGTAFSVISSADTHTFNFPATPIFTGVSTTNATSSNLRVWGTTILNGNTMPTTTCATGEMPVAYSSGVLQCRATSTLGLQSTLTTGNLTAGTGLSFDNTRQVIGGAAQVSIASGYQLMTDASSTEFASSSNRVIKNAGKWDTSYSFAHATATESVAGLEFSAQDLQLTTGYVIPLSASTTNWNTAYNTVNSSSTYWDTAYNRVNGTLSDGKYCTYASATGKISCNSTPSTGITSLAGQTGATQLFATGTKPTGLDFKVVSSGDTHTFTLSVDGTYAIPLSASTTNWNNTYNTVNSSSSNWDIAYVKGVSAYGQAHATATESITGIDLIGQNFSLTSGYIIPTTASTTNYDSAYNRVYNGTYTDGKYCTYASATGKISCISEGGTAGISSLAGQTGATQTISTTTGTGLSFKVVSSANNHDFQASIASGYNLVTDASSTEFASSSNKVIKTAPNWDTAYSVINSSSSNWDIAHNRTTKGTLTATKLCTWNAGGYFDCNTDPFASSGFTTTTFKTAYQSYATTTLNFATSSDTNLGLAVLVDTTGITLTPQWIGTLADGRITSATKWNALDTASTTWNTAYSFAHATATETVIGLEFSGQDLQLTTGYNIPLTASTTNWNNAYDIVNASSSNWTSAYSQAHATATESILGIDLTGQEFSLTAGYIIPTTASTTNYDAVYNKMSGTMTDAKYCTYSSATGKISCNSEGGSSGGTTVFVTTTPSLILPTSTLATYDFMLGSTATASAPFWWDVSATTSYIGKAGAGDGAIDFTHNGTQAMTLGYDYSAGKFRFSTTTDFSTGNILSFSTSTLGIELGGFIGSATECDYGTSTSATTTIDFASTTKPCFSNMARVEIATTTSVLSIVNPPLNGNIDIRIFQGSSVTTTLSFASNIAFEGGFLPSLPYGTSTESLISCKYRTVAGSNSTKNFKCQLSKDWK